MDRPNHVSVVWFAFFCVTNQCAVHYEIILSLKNKCFCIMAIIMTSIIIYYDCYFVNDYNDWLQCVNLLCVRNSFSVKDLLPCLTSIHKAFLAFALLKDRQDCIRVCENIMLSILFRSGLKCFFCVSHYGSYVSLMFAPFHFKLLIATPCQDGCRWI